MKRIVVTNNKKVENKFSGRAEIRMLQQASCYQVYEAAREVAAQGGRLLIDPTRGGADNFYKSVVFMLEEGAQPDEKSLNTLEKCMAGVPKAEGMGKEPMLAGILQNKEVDMLKKVLC